MTRSASPPSDPGFEVEIQRGRRAVDVAGPGSPAAPPGPPAATERTIGAGPARPVARRRANLQQRVLTGVLIAAILVVAGVFALSWWSAQPPPGVLARVNGENITVAQVDREILLNRAITALLSGKEETPSRFTTVESLIDRRMKAQDAERAQVPVADADIAAFVANLITRNGKTMDDLDTALQGYGLTRADLYAEQRDVVLINSYIGLKVTAGATDNDTQQRLINDWVTQLQRTSKVDRFGVPDEPIAPRIGATAPDFTLRDLGEQIHTLSDLHGRPVVINFWATWCDPCRQELPVIQAGYTRAAATGPKPGPGLEVLGVAVFSDPAVIASFQKEFGLRYPLLPDDSGQIKDLYRVGPIPTSFFLDRQGIIREIKIGSLDEADLNTKLKLIP